MYEVLIIVGQRQLHYGRPIISLPLAGDCLPSRSVAGEARTRNAWLSRPRVARASGSGREGPLAVVAEKCLWARRPRLQPGSLDVSGAVQSQVMDPRAPGLLGCVAIRCAW